MYEDLERSQQAEVQVGMLEGTAYLFVAQGVVPTLSFGAASRLAAEVLEAAELLWPGGDMERAPKTDVELRERVGKKVESQVPPFPEEEKVDETLEAFSGRPLERIDCPRCCASKGDHPDPSCWVCLGNGSVFRAAKGEAAP